MPPAILAGGVPSLNYSPPCDSCALPRFKESTEGEPRWPCIPRPPPTPCRIPGAAARRLLLELVFLACRTGGGDGGHGRAGRTAGAVIGERSWLWRLLGCGFKDPGRGSIWRSERSCRLRILITSHSVLKLKYHKGNLLLGSANNGVRWQGKSKGLWPKTFHNKGEEIC